MQLKGKVVRLENFGAFIDIGAARPGLVHVSELSSDYVTNPADIVSVGDEVEVRVVELDRKKRQIRLSMKEMVPEKYGKDKLDKIIKEEMGHIRRLSKELVGLKNQ